MAQHTPGPWIVKRRFDIYEDGKFVGSTRGNWPLPESINVRCEADAKLMADAPAMLELLREIVGSESFDKNGDRLFWVGESLMVRARELIDRHAD